MACSEKCHRATWPAARRPQASARPAARRQRCPRLLEPERRLPATSSAPAPPRKTLRRAPAIAGLRGAGMMPNLGRLQARRQRLGRQSPAARTAAAPRSPPGMSEYPSNTNPGVALPSARYEVHAMATYTVVAADTPACATGVGRACVRMRACACAARPPGQHNAARAGMQTALSHARSRQPSSSSLRRAAAHTGRAGAWRGAR